MKDLRIGKGWFYNGVDDIDDDALSNLTDEVIDIVMGALKTKEKVNCVGSVEVALYERGAKDREPFFYFPFLVDGCIDTDAEKNLKELRANNYLATSFKMIAFGPGFSSEAVVATNVKIICFGTNGVPDLSLAKEFYEEVNSGLEEKVNNSVSQCVFGYSSNIDEIE